MKEWPEDDPLWKLLGQTPEPRPSAWLPSHIIRAVRQKAARPVSASWLRVRVWIGALACLSLVAVPLAMLYLDHTRSTSPLATSISHQENLDKTMWADSFEKFDQQLLEDDIQWLADN